MPRGRGSAGVLDICPRCRLLWDTARCSHCGHSKSNKYSAKATICCPDCTAFWPAVDGAPRRCLHCGCEKCIRFPSLREMTRYNELKCEQLAGLIDGLELQPMFAFPTGFHYRGDFKYLDLRTGKVVVEDVKGTKTPVFRLKAKCFKYFYNNPELRVTK